MTAPRRPRPPNDAPADGSDPITDALQLIRAFAKGLPEALDDEMAARLAARVRPFLSMAADREPAVTRLLTVAEAAALAHVHVETIRRAVRDGRLVIAGRVGRSVRIQPADLRRWLAGATDGGETIRASPARRVRRSMQTSEYSLKAALKQSR